MRNAYIFNCENTFYKSYILTLVFVIQTHSLYILGEYISHVIVILRLRSFRTNFVNLNIPWIKVYCKWIRLSKSARGNICKYRNKAAYIDTPAISRGRIGLQQHMFVIRGSLG